jgi:hypothetical protein
VFVGCLIELAILGFYHIEKQLGKITRGLLRARNIKFIFSFLVIAKNDTGRPSWHQFVFS